MATLVLEQLVGGTRVSDERTGEETGIVRYIAYQKDDNGNKITGSPFTPNVLKSNATYLDTIKTVEAPPGTSYDRYDAQQYGSSLYDLEVTVYFSKNGRYGGPTTDDGGAGDEPTYSVSSTTELRQFTIPVPSVQQLLVPGVTEPLDSPGLRAQTDTTPITTINLNVRLDTYNVGIQRVINEKVNQLHYIGEAGSFKLYRFKGAKSIRNEGEFFSCRYEWEYDIGSPAREWNEEGGPRVFGDITADPEEYYPVPQLGPVTFNNARGWWRPPYFQVGAGDEKFPYRPPFFTQDVILTRPAPVLFVDGLLDDLVGHLSLPGVS